VLLVKRSSGYSWFATSVLFPLMKYPEMMGDATLILHVATRPSCCEALIIVFEGGEAAGHERERERERERASECVAWRHRHSVVSRCVAFHRPFATSRTRRSPHALFSIVPPPFMSAVSLA
jgi:hypothetical protein